MLLGDGAKGNKFANAGVGENDVDSPLLFRDGLVKTIKVGEFGNGAPHARNVAADCLYGLVEFLLAAARPEDMGAPLHAEVSVRQAKSSRAPGHAGDRTFECVSPAF